ncbi:hypothetical protein DL93DRAFT_2103248, partial [Clavulina sp. PMI_390]
LMEEIGIDVNLSDEDGYTPLHVAVEGELDDVEILLNAGADPNKCNNEGDAPLDIVVRKIAVYEDVVSVLSSIQQNPSISQLVYQFDKCIDKSVEWWRPVLERGQKQNLLNQERKHLAKPRLRVEYTQKLCTQFWQSCGVTRLNRADQEDAERKKMRGADPVLVPDPKIFMSLGEKEKKRGLFESLVFLHDYSEILTEMMVVSRMTPGGQPKGGGGGSKNTKGYWGATEEIIRGVSLSLEKVKDHCKRACRGEFEGKDNVDDDDGDNGRCRLEKTAPI